MQRDIAKELKELRLHGMAGAWGELTTHECKQTDVGVQTSRWLIEHLLQAEHTQRAMTSIRHQMKVARFPLHRDLAGFDFEASKVDKKLVNQLSTLAFTDTAQNAVLIGGPGTGKTHLATAIGVAGIAAKGKRVRFYSTVDLVNELEREKREGKAGRIALALMRMDFGVLDELGYLPFSQAGGALLFHLARGTAKGESSTRSTGGRRAVLRHSQAGGIHYGLRPTLDSPCSQQEDKETTKTNY